MRSLASVETSIYLSIVKGEMYLHQGSARHPFSFQMLLESSPLSPSLHVLETRKSNAFLILSFSIWAHKSQ